MADIDVEALSLSSPPAQAPVAAYRPGIAVRNNGRSPVSATGWLSVYDRATGLLIGTFPVSAASINPGATKNALSALYWTPTQAQIGKYYLWSGSITCPGDQVPANNSLPPVTILVTGDTPPGPQPVEDHAAQHENGGGDEINLDGLAGVLTERQRPEAHADEHQVNGTDELTLAGLPGLLADPQIALPHGSTHEAGGSDQVTGVVAAAHHESHEPGGSDVITGVTPATHATSHQAGEADELSVANLSGTLADPQTPAAHHESHEAGGSDMLALFPGVVSFVLSQFTGGQTIPIGDTAEASSYGWDHVGRKVGALFSISVTAQMLAPGENVSVSCWIRAIFGASTIDGPETKTSFPNTGLSAADIFLCLSNSQFLDAPDGFTTVKLMVRNDSTVPIGIAIGTEVFLEAA